MISPLYGLTSLVPPSLNKRGGQGGEILLILFTISSLFAATVPIEQVSERSGKYFIVNKKIEVKEGDTLLIPEGSEVLFAPLTGITLLNGSTLIAHGTRSAPVYLSSLKDTAGLAAPFDWIGIDAQRGAKTRLSFTCVAYSTSGLTAADSAAVRLDSCVFTKNGQWGLSMNGVISQLPEGTPFSFSSVPYVAAVATPRWGVAITPRVANTPRPDSTYSTGSRPTAKNRILLTLGVVSAVAGAYFLIRADNAADTYNSLVPGNPDYDGKSASARQEAFDNYRGRYALNLGIGAACFTFSGINMGIFLIKWRF